MVGYIMWIFVFVCTSEKYEWNDIGMQQELYYNHIRKNATERCAYFMGYSGETTEDNPFKTILKHKNTRLASNSHYSATVFVETLNRKIIWHQYYFVIFQTMMTSLNGNIFRVTGHLCGEFTGGRWLPRTKVSDAEHWYFLWSAPE